LVATSNQQLATSNQQQMKHSPKSTVFLIPTFIDEDNLEVIPPYIIDAVKQCNIFFVENERSARRYLKRLWKEIVIDNYQWIAIDKTEDNIKKDFIHSVRQGKTVGIISEAGCPGVADPGQLLIRIAHEERAIVKPLVGPSSILLALMASGMNGQRFSFIGYLPIDPVNRIKSIKAIEAESLKENCTQIFIETPYRNNQLLKSLLQTCKPATLLCIAADMTSVDEFIQTKQIDEWKQNIPDLHKRPTIFCLLSS
jgi:16S rRNA (cytidine1402-2'-O)-methyltransferase